MQVRLQTQSVGPGIIPRYSGPIDCFRTMAREEGFRSLFKGTQILSSDGTCNTYDDTLDYLRNECSLRHKSNHQCTGFLFLWNDSRVSSERKRKRRWSPLGCNLAHNMCRCCDRIYCVSHHHGGRTSKDSTPSSTKSWMVRSKRAFSR